VWCGEVVVGVVDVGVVGLCDFDVDVVREEFYWWVGVVVEGEWIGFFVVFDGDD